MQTVNWKQLIATGVVSLIVALTAYYIENPSADLVYAVDRISLNSGDGDTYRVAVWNDGSNTIENVQLQVRQGSIDVASIFVDASFSHKATYDLTGIKVDSPILNAGERLSVSWRVPNGGGAPAIGVRGKGATGYEREPSSSSYDEIVTALLAGACAALMALVGWHFLNRRRSRFPSRDLVEFYVKRPDAHAWLSRRLKPGSETNTIDVMGVKVDSLYRILKRQLEIGPPPHNLTIRVLALAPDSPGAKQRQVLEGHEKVVGDADQYSKLWPKLAKDLEKYPLTKIEVRFFHVCPTFYIVRVNRDMLAGTYLSGSGYEGLTFVLNREDGSVFDQFQGYFDKVWEASAL